ncbi:hypothetical protein HID58_033341 [Brassica napus]|uniref:Disease resistance protein n=1 Tax=Brassica napus TaxID=3708 RepID=A0ABQ8BYY1_BRANA|nr:hypothetical protein HID58_033341 [Brassica napus]
MKHRACMKVRRRRKTAAADQGLWKYNVSETVHLFHGVLQYASLSCLLQYGSEQPRNVFCDVIFTEDKRVEREFQRSELPISPRDSEAAMIKKIATDISNMLNSFTPLSDFDGLVGMGAHLEKMEPLLGLGSDEVRMIGIWGPPGIGKTTIARVAYNQLSEGFQLSIFMDDIKGSKNVIGMKLDYYKIEKELDISDKAFEGMSNLQFLKVYGYSDTLQLTRGLNYLPRKLRLLEWSHFPMRYFPSTLNLEFLVELTIRHSKLEKLWEGIKPLRSLKWMNLSYSVNLKELPDLSTATSLKKLNLNACSSLTKLPPPIGYTNNLEVLNLRKCSSLIKLPSLAGDATSLEKLYIGGCSSLVEFPSVIGNALNLRKLDLSSFPNLLELPSYVGNATNLEKLYLSNCLDLVELPLSLGNLQKLQKLILKGCNKLEFLPSNINLESLEKLDLSGCSSLDLGGFSIIGNVINLQTLDISRLPQLLELPSFIRIPDLENNLYKHSTLKNENQMLRQYSEEHNMKQERRRVLPGTIFQQEGITVYIIGFLCHEGPRAQ